MRTRLYAKCTNAEIEEYLDRGGDTLFIGVGVTELHGHLPVDCETIIVEAAALKMAEMADGLAVTGLPYFNCGATAIGRSSVNISIKAGYDYLKAVTYAFYKLGFKRMFFITCHGPAYLTCNSVCMDFFHETHNPICHMDLGHVMNIARENGWNKDGNLMSDFNNMMYGAYKIMKQLEYIPVVTDCDDEAFMAKRKEGNARQWYKKDLHKLDIGTGVFGSFYDMLEEHGGLEYSRTEEERAERGEKGEKLFDEMIKAFDPAHFNELLKALDHNANVEIVPKYPHLELDPFKPYK